MLTSERNTPSMGSDEPAYCLPVIGIWPLHGNRQMTQPDNSIKSFGFGKT